MNSYTIEEYAIQKVQIAYEHSHGNGDDLVTCLRKRICDFIVTFLLIFFT